MAWRRGRCGLHCRCQVAPAWKSSKSSAVKPSSVVPANRRSWPRFTCSSPLTTQALRPALSMARREAPASLDSFWIRFGETFAGIFVFSGTRKLDGAAQRAGDVQDFLLKVRILIQRLMRGGVRLHVSDVAVGLRHAAG